MSQRIIREDKDGLCTLILNRPDKLNALDSVLFKELETHVAALGEESDRIGCVVLRANGRAFCAGADLGEIGNVTSDFNWRPRIIEALSLLPQPVIAAVHGVCYTGGLELALACDFIVADATARFADTHGKWGIVGSWGISQRLPRRVGIQAAKRMMMTAQPVGAAEAHVLGLADLLAEEGKLDDVLTPFVADILANSWFTNFANKRMLAHTDGMPIAQGLAQEVYRHPGRAPDYRERIDGFKKS